MLQILISQVKQNKSTPQKFNHASLNLSIKHSDVYKFIHMSVSLLIISTVMDISLMNNKSILVFQTIVVK